jgi:hypothetical protein
MFFFGVLLLALKWIYNYSMIAFDAFLVQPSRIIRVKRASEQMNSRQSVSVSFYPTNHFTCYSFDKGCALTNI